MGLTSEVQSWLAAIIVAGAAIIQIRSWFRSRRNCSQCALVKIHDAARAAKAKHS